MKNPKTRREFLKDTGKTGIGLILAPSLVNWKTSGSDPIGYSQAPLTYAYNAIEPAIDAMTMEIHFTKHAAGYAKNLADALKEEQVDPGKTKLEDLLNNISRYSVKMRNNAGGHYNHELFWRTLKAPVAGNKPTGHLAKQIEKDFGSFEAFQKQFSDAAKARFGSGWAWLVWTPEKKLVVSSTPNQDNPLMNIADVIGQPVLGLDVWEHAYYLKYQNRRPDYISAWWDAVDWKGVEISNKK